MTSNKFKVGDEVYYYDMITDDDGYDLDPDDEAYQDSDANYGVVCDAPNPEGETFGVVVWAYWNGKARPTYVSENRVHLYKAAPLKTKRNLPDWW